MPDNNYPYPSQRIQKQKTPSSGSGANLLIPIAILIAGILIAGSIYMNRASVAKEKITVQTPAQSKINTDAFVPVSRNENVLGNLDTAKVVIVDYSDLECPYCKLLHETIKRIYADYADTGKVAWVYRHYPLSIHSKAPREAQASECVRELGGNDAFWKFISLVYEVTPSNDGLDLTQLPIIASSAGVNKDDFQTCLDSGAYAQKVKESYDNALKLTTTEVTPFTVLIADGKVIPLVDEDGVGYGAGLPYPTFKALIEQLIK